MINWGIVGLGNMAHHFANSINNVENANLVAIASSSKSKSEKFGEQFNLDKNNRHSNYKDIISCSNIDAIYISTLNNLHSDLTKFFLKSGKKVLCEKPYSIDLEETKEILELTKTTKNSFFEAIAYVCHPQTEKLLSLINKGEIGTLKKIESNFGFKVKKIRAKSRLFNKNLGGGAIFDLGCYPISFVNLFCDIGTEINITKAIGNICETNVENHAELTGYINNDVEVDLKVSFKEDLENCCKIYGSKGLIKITTPWLPEKKSFLEIHSKESYYKIFVNSKMSVYKNQIHKVSEIFNNDKNKILNNLIDIYRSEIILKKICEWKNLIS